MVIANYFLRTWVLIELNTSLALLPTLSKHSEFDYWYIPFMKLLSCAVDISGLGCAILKSLQSCLTLCDPMDCSPPGSSVHGILQARILEWVAMPSSSRSSQPRDRTCISCISCIAGRFFTHWVSWEAEVNISAAHQILLILPSRHLLGLHLPTSYKCSYGQVTYFSKCSMTRSDMCHF